MDYSLLVPAGAVLLCLLLAAFFSSAETAMTAASRPRMMRLEQQGNRRAALVNRLYEQKERMIGALLLGNNTVNILASALTTGVLIGFFGDAGIVYATVAITILVLIFAEVLPKTYAIMFPDRSALGLAPLVRVVLFLFAPPTVAVEAIVKAILRGIGVQRRSMAQDAELNEEVLRGAIEMHTAGEEDTPQERHMLRSILDLGDLTVEDVMTHRGNITLIDAELPAAVVLDQVLGSPYTRIPLYRGQPDNIVGVIHAKALLRAIHANKENIDAVDVAAVASPPWFVPDATTLLDQLNAFRAKREHFALVVDEYGTLQGVVTLEDILEEIVGDITDEHDMPSVGVTPQADGSFIAEGKAPVRDLNRELGWRLPEDVATTIAGLVLHEARRIPEVGQSYTFYGYRFEIMGRERNRITALRVIPPASEEPPPSGES
jgi:Mg2+/Co2+ transporter CorB